MAYEDNPVGHTILKKGRIGNLSVSWDYEDDPNDSSQRSPVFRFTPDMESAKEHHHIKLSYKQADALKDWLDEYLLDAWVEDITTLDDIREIFQIPLDRVFTTREMDRANAFKRLGCMNKVANQFSSNRERVRQILAKVKRKCNKLRSENEANI